MVTRPESHRTERPAPLPQPPTHACLLPPHLEQNCSQGAASARLLGLLFWLLAIQESLRRVLFVLGVSVATDTTAGGRSGHTLAAAVQALSLLTIPRLSPIPALLQHGPSSSKARLVGGRPCRHNIFPRLCLPATTSWPAPFLRGTHHQQPPRPRHPAVLPFLHHEVRTSVARVLLAEAEPGLECGDGSGYYPGRCLSVGSGRKEDDCSVFYSLGRL